MCWGNPTKSLELARARLTPEQWAKFEDDFDHFCAYAGLVREYPGEYHEWMEEQFAWAKLAFLKGQGL